MQSLLEPGTSLVIYRLFQASTVALLVLLFGLHFTGATANYHVYILLFLTFGLFASVTWVVSEIGLEAENKDTKDGGEKPKTD